MIKFAELLAEHWPRYVATAGGPIPSAHWRAVEAVLSCRTERRGGSRHHCTDCKRTYYQYHSCNHRSCPQCGSAAQANWAAVQESKLLPVPYYMVTVTVPEELRPACLYYPEELYGTLLAQSAQGLQDLCGNPKYIGGRAGFTAVLQTWTRRMLHHPHVHILIPAVAVAESGCRLIYPKNEEYLVNIHALGLHIRTLFRNALVTRHPQLFDKINPVVWEKSWNIDCRSAGHGRQAVRYLAAYVAKSAFKEERLIGYDDQGRVILSYKDSDDNRWKTEALEPPELIRRWLLHVLPKGFVAVRHFGWLSPAAGKTLNRVRFLLGRGPVVKPPRQKHVQECPCCKKPTLFLGAIPAARGPPLSRRPLSIAV